jgi:hypothetical protein
MKFATICRTKEIRGFTFPGIIHNGGYYFTDLEVFADGLVNCWEMVDFPLFKAKLRKGWVVTSIPDGAVLGIHGIGDVEVAEPEWAHTPDSLVAFVKDMVKALNPRLENLYDCHGRDTEVINGIRYAAVNTDNPRPWKTDEPITPLVSGLFGHSLRHFQVHNNALHLVTIQLFNDDSALIFGRTERQTLNFDELMKQLENRDLFRFPEPGESVVIDGLVNFKAGNWEYCVEPNQLMAEFHDLHNRAQGKPGAIEECMKAFQQYSTEPTAKTLKTLREKYEAVPEHLRMYCGDMDVKDIPIRMALYGKGEIENWSHYQAAKSSGEKLPSITIPEPPDEKP